MSKEGNQEDLGPVSAKSTGNAVQDEVVQTSSTQNSSMQSEVVQSALQGNKNERAQAETGDLGAHKASENMAAKNSQEGKSFLMECPGCQEEVQVGIIQCQFCKILLAGPLAARLWRVDQNVISLKEEREDLILTLRNKDYIENYKKEYHLDKKVKSKKVKKGGAHEYDYFAGTNNKNYIKDHNLKDQNNNQQGKPFSGQKVLLGLGALLLVLAVGVFLAVAWSTLGRTGQVGAAGVLTLLAIYGSFMALEKSLFQTAETFASLGAILLLLDLFALRSLGLVPEALMSGTSYTLLTLALSGAVLLVLARERKLYSYGIAGSLVLQAVPSLVWVLFDLDASYLALFLLLQSYLNIFGKNTLKSVHKVASIFSLLSLYGAGFLAVSFSLDENVYLNALIAILVGLSAFYLGYKKHFGTATSLLGGIAVGGEVLNIIYELNKGEGVLSLVIISSLALFVVALKKNLRNEESFSNKFSNKQSIKEVLASKSTRTSKNAVSTFTAGYLLTLYLLGTLILLTIGKNSELSLLFGVYALVFSGGFFLQTSPFMRKFCLSLAITNSVLFLKNLLELLQVSLGLEGVIIVLSGSVLLLISMLNSEHKFEHGVKHGLGHRFKHKLGYKAGEQASLDLAQTGNKDLIAALSNFPFVLGLLLALDGGYNWFSLGLFITGLSTLYFSTGSGKGWFAPLGSLLISSGLWVLLLDREVTVIEYYSLPLAALVLLLGIIRKRRDPRTTSYLTYGPATFIALLPSTQVAIVSSGLVRPFLVLLAASIILLVAVHHKQQGPLLGAILSIAEIGISQTAPYANLIPRWALLAVFGSLLLAAGISYEKRLQDTKKAFEWVKEMQ